MTSTPLRIAAISFLNPAPLMWDFEHPPLADDLAQRYHLHYTDPSRCAAQLLSGQADLGLIPVAALTPELAIVPGCTIASLDRVRSIQLILKPNPKTPGQPHTLTSVRTVATDTASRSSAAYTEILFRKFAGSRPAFVPCPADPVAMLRSADAALLIGDPALLALENRTGIEADIGPCTWIDLAQAWHQQTGLPWVAAVWAVRPHALHATGLSPHQLIADLNLSRVHSLEHIEDLVREWSPRLALPPAVVRDYLTSRIHYILDPPCIEAITLFRQYAAELDLLPPLPHLRFLEADQPA